MFCRNCGQEINNNADVCIHCGINVQREEPMQQHQAQRANSSDAPSAGYTVLGVFFWYIGLILYLVWKNEYPLRAKSCLKGMIIGLCISAGLVVFYIAMISCAVSMGALANLLPLVRFII